MLYYGPRRCGEAWKVDRRTAASICRFLEGHVTALPRYPQRRTRAGSAAQRRRGPTKEGAVPSVLEKPLVAFPAALRSGLVRVAFSVARRVAIRADFAAIGPLSAPLPDPRLFQGPLGGLDRERPLLADVLHEEARRVVDPRLQRQGPKVVAADRGSLLLHQLARHVDLDVLVYKRLDRLFFL